MARTFRFYHSFVFNSCIQMLKQICDNWLQVATIELNQKNQLERHGNKMSRKIHRFRLVLKVKPEN